MEYIEGVTLAQIVQRAEQSGIAIPRPVALRILLDALSGLHAAHELHDESGRPLGLVHRDVSPQGANDGTARAHLRGGRRGDGARSVRRADPQARADRDRADDAAHRDDDGDDGDGDRACDGDGERDRESMVGMTVMKAHGNARRRARGTMLGALLAVSLTAQVGRADPSAEAKAGARAAAERGGAEYKAARYKEALDLFLRAETLIHAPTHVLMIARTQAALGDLVLAKESYLEITREALASNAPPAFKRARTDAEKELKELEPRIPSVQITVQGARGPKDLVVSMDDKPVPAALVGIPRPVNPGKHAFKATATGFAAPEKSLTVKEGDALAIALDLAPVMAISRSDGGPPAGPGGAATAGAGDQVTPSKAGKGRYVGVAMMGVGAVGLVVGGVFSGLYASKRGEANAAFDACGKGCSDAPAAAVRALDEDANGKGTIGVTGLVAGGALAIGGAVLFLVSKPRAAPAAAHVEPWIGYGSGGVSGSF